MTPKPALLGPAMKTLLSQFCDEFGEVVGPLLEPLRSLSQTLGSANDHGVLGGAPGSPAPEYVASFQDLQDRLERLAEKVAEQQAYVLIFGPLKSGKSTLMNSISAAYVSEVTALPAYPCMVFVNHAPEREFVVTRYNGSTQTFGAPASMRMQVNRDHAELADRIRAEERAGRDFDPALHFPEAIRRIDVKVHAEELSQSGAVLVDTPGLYSRMKFGYDRMTREFRNAAACAIFVVKTDNLFLEQVFEEFNDLLELFSRVFLVVNLDSTKMDLRPDGTLTPSLEREDPVRIVQAFETLSMSSPIKAAVEEGRLRLYPVDLQRAASKRLQSKAQEAAGQPTETGDQDGDFSAFLGDLTEYLNSTDYLLAFLGDSLKQAGLLMTEGTDLCSASSVRALVRRAEELASERTAEQQRIATHDRLDKIDWTPSFESLERGLAESVTIRANQLEQATLARIDESVDAWFETDAGLRHLIDDGLMPALAAYQTGVAGDVEQALRERSNTGSAGALIADGLARDLDFLRVRLGDFASEGHISVLPRACVHQAKVPIDLSEMPIRKSLMDWLLLRTQNKLRRKFVGDGSGEGVAERVPRTVKLKRFGDAGRSHLCNQIRAALGGWFDQSRRRIAARECEDFRKGVVTALDSRLATLRGTTESLLAEIDGQLSVLRKVSAQLESLESALERSNEEVADLTTRYAETDPTELVRELVLDQAAEAEGDEPVYELHPSEDLAMEDEQPLENGPAPQDLPWTTPPPAPREID